MTSTRFDGTPSANSTAGDSHSTDCNGCVGDAYLGDNEDGLQEGTDDITKLLCDLARSITDLAGDFGNFARRFVRSEPCRTVGRRRCLFLTCRIPADLDFKWPFSWSNARQSAALCLGNLALAALSYLYDDKSSPVIGPPTQLLRTVHLRIISKVALFVDKLETYTGSLCHDAAFASLVGRGTTDKYPKLVADQVDLLSTCGGVDPLACLSDEMASVVNDPLKMFPSGIKQVARAATFRGGSREQYLLLLKRQLDVGKVGLVARAFASGGTFAVGKKPTGRQREVWD